MKYGKGPAGGDYERLLAPVCFSFGVSKSILHSDDKCRKTVEARRALAICLREMGYSYPEIGEAMGRDHTSAMRMCNPDTMRSERLKAQAARTRRRVRAVIRAAGQGKRVPQAPEPSTWTPVQEPGLCGRAVRLLTATRSPDEKDRIWAHVAEVLERRPPERFEAVSEAPVAP